MNLILIVKMAGARPQTRSSSSHFVFGSPLSPEDVDQRMLPTYGTMMRRFLYEIQDRKTTDQILSSIFEILSFELQTKWKQGGIPTITDSAIRNRLKLHLWEDYKDANKQKSRREEQNDENKRWIEGFKCQKGFDTLFNIAKCQCYKRAKSTAEIMDGTIQCSCGNPIPEKELLFYAHQLFERGKPHCLTIGQVDPEAVRQQIREEERLRKEFDKQLRLEAQRRRESQSVPRCPFTNRDLTQVAEITPPSELEVEDETSDDDFGEGMKTKKNCKVPYKLNALGALRYGDSTRSARAHINWTVRELLQYGALNRHFSDNIEQLMISVEAFRDRQTRYGGELVDMHSFSSKKFVCLKFDGKKTKTLVNSSRLEVKEHIVVISEPNATYLDHFIPESGKGAHIANEMYSLLTEYDSIDSLLVVGSDGTSANTGRNLGAIRQLELKLERNLQW